MMSHVSLAELIYSVYFHHMAQHCIEFQSQPRPHDRTRD